MTKYVALFHTELSALITYKRLRAAGISARRAPVPRKLSASCGVCVFYEADASMLSLMDTDFQDAYEIIGDDAYRRVEADH